MSIRAKTYIDDLISINSIVTVYYRNMTGGSTSGDKHDFWEFQYVDKGNYQIMADDTRYDLTEGQLIVYAPNVHHYGTGEKYSAQVGIVSFESDSAALKNLPAKVFTLNLNQKELLSEIITNGVDMFVPVSPDSGLIGLVARDDVSPAKFQKLKHQLEMFLTELYLGNGKDTQKPIGTNQSNYRKSQFDEIEDYLKDNLDKSFTLEELSLVFSISTSKLKMIFKEESGSSPISYFTSLKIKKAKQLIRETSLNFTQISESLGFSTVHYFSKLFKEKTGVTPTEYAKSVYKK